MTLYECIDAHPVVTVIIALVFFGTICDVARYYFKSKKHICNCHKEKNEIEKD